MKRTFTFGVVLTTILWSVGAAALVPTAALAATQGDETLCENIVAGNLIKTHGNTAIWAVNEGLTRSFFVNSEYFHSWNNDGDYKKHRLYVTDACMNSFETVSSVVPRSGTYLLDDPSTDYIWAVLPGNVITQISSAAAEELYGDDYATERYIEVDVASWTFWSDYRTAGEITELVPHEGMLVKYSDEYYFVEAGMVLRKVTESGITANRFDTKWAYEMTTTEGFTMGDDIEVEETTISDRTQGLETTPTVDPEVPVVTGSASISLSANTPEGGNVVKSSEVQFSKIMLTAGSDGAIIVNSLKIGRQGLGSVDDFTSVTLYDGSIKLGSTKTSWNSDNTMTYNIAGGWTIPAGTTKELTIAGILSAAGTYNALGVVAVTGVGLETSGLPVYGNQMSAVNVTVGTVIITNVGTNSTKKIGTSDVTLAEFKLAVDSKEDSTFEAITLKNKAASPNASDGDISNLYLYKGSEMLAGPVSMVSDKIVFVLDTPYAIDKSKNETFKVVGDVVNGAANKVEFNLDTSSDLKLRGDTYKTYLTVTDTLAASGMVVLIDGAELNIAYSGTNLDSVDDKTDVVFGTLTMSAGATDIKVTSMQMNVVETDGNSTSTDNKDVDLFEMVDTVGGAAYSGTVSSTTGGDTDSDTEVWTFTDEIYLSAGETRTFEFRGDLPAGIGNGDSYKVTMTVNDTNLVAETVPAGDSVDNFSTASFTGKTVTVKSPTLKVTGVTMNDGTAVVNDENVIIYKGALEASADDIHVSYANFDAIGGTFTVANWTEVGFYLVNADGTYSTTPGEYQVVGNSSMTNNTLSFDSLDFDVLNGTTNKVNFVLKGKVAATVAATFAASLDLDYFTAKDGENNDVVYSPTTAGTVGAGYITTGNRIVTLADTGKLYIQMVNNVTGYNKDQVVLAGTEFWAGKIKMRADDEPIKIKDLKLTNATDDDEDSISEVCLYTAELATEENLIGCADMDTDNVVFFDDIDQVVAQGTEYWYIHVATKAMSNGADGTADSSGLVQTFADTIAMSIATSTTGYLAAEGDKSGSTFAVGAHDAGAVVAGKWYFDYDMDNIYNEVADADGTAATKSFYIAGTKISNVAFVDSYEGVNVATAIEATGSTTLAIVAITADGNGNTDADGNILKVAIDNFSFDITKFNDVGISGATIERISGVTASPSALTAVASSTGTGANDVGGAWSLANVTTTLGNDALIDSGSIAYFAIVGNISALSVTTNETNWITVALNDLKGGVGDGNNNIDWFDGYETTFATASNFDYLFLSNDSLAGTQISATKNN